MNNEAVVVTPSSRIDFYRGELLAALSRPKLIRVPIIEFDRADAWDELLAPGE